MRLIDADSMKADLLTVDPQYETMIQWCITVLDAQPTIELERKTGKWLKELGAYRGGYPRFIYHCSICGNVEEHAYADSKCSRYCPNCGAKMEGEQ